MKSIIAGIIIAFLLLGKKVYAMKKSHNPPAQLYKILSMEKWQESQNKPHLSLPENDTDFIHFSTAKQVEYVVKKYYKNKPYVLLTINTTKVTGTFKLEPNSSKTDNFYHLYNGFIPVTAIAKQKIIEQ